LEYDNLVYLCTTCNGIKSAKLVPDPCQVALGRCVWVSDDGQIHAHSKEGRLLVKALRLDNKDYTRMRKTVIGILNSLYVNERALFVQMMSFPRDLPNLATLSPPGNTRPSGVEQSFHSLREKGKCPQVY